MLFLEILKNKNFAKFKFECSGIGSKFIASFFPLKIKTVRVITVDINLLIVHPRIT